MAHWDLLRERLAMVEDEITLEWGEIDAMVGGLPASAYTHRPFWSGDRSAWAGFTTRAVRVRESVTFVRRTPKATLDDKLDGATVRVPSGSTALLERASQLTGITDEEQLVVRGLEILVRVEAGRRLAALGGSDPAARTSPRRREGRR